jgi:thioredoxin reductase
MYDIAIVGAGPAGASAALFAAKAGKKVLLLDSDQGMTRRAWVENHYGVEKISGTDLVDLGHRQATRFGAWLVKTKVTGIQRKDEGFELITDDGSYAARYVILATGATVELAQAAGVETIPGTEPRIKAIVKTDRDGRTNIPGIWAAGTCAGVSVHTIVTAGDGAKVAINLLSEINGERYVDHDFVQK